MLTYKSRCRECWQTLRSDGICVDFVQNRSARHGQACEVLESVYELNWKQDSVRHDDLAIILDRGGTHFHIPTQLSYHAITTSQSGVPTL